MKFYDPDNKINLINMAKLSLLVSNLYLFKFIYIYMYVYIYVYIYIIYIYIYILIYIYIYIYIIYILNFLKRIKHPIINIFLINFMSNYEQTLLNGKLYHCFDCFIRENLACRITRIDYTKALNSTSFSCIF